MTAVYAEFIFEKNAVAVNPEHVLYLAKASGVTPEGHKVHGTRVFFVGGSNIWLGTSYHSTVSMLRRAAHALPLQPEEPIMDINVEGEDDPTFLAEAHQKVLRAILDIHSLGEFPEFIKTNPIAFKAHLKDANAGRLLQDLFGHKDCAHDDIKKAWHMPSLVKIIFDEYDVAVEGEDTAKDDKGDIAL